MKQDSANKVWFIAGASRGPARALAETVLDAGDSLVATPRPGENLDDLMITYGQRVFPLFLDLIHPVGAQAAVDVAFSAFGRIDVVVDNAGCTPGHFEESTPAELEVLLATGLTEVAPVTVAALPLLRRQGFGCVLRISSIVEPGCECASAGHSKPVEVS